MEQQAITIQLHNFNELLENTDQLYNALLTEIGELIDKETKFLLRKPTVRKTMLEKYGKDAFLIPEKLKFPVINPKTGKYDCGLIYAAYLRANQWQKKHPEYKKVADKAKELFDKIKCDTKIKVKINENEVIDIDEFIITYLI